jgi:predicted DNA repair protein MutK
MQNHIVKRLGIFLFWLLAMIAVVAFKSNFVVERILISSIIPLIILLILSGIFLLYESTELKRQGKKPIE